MYLEIKRTVTSVSKIPYNEDMYPDMDIHKAVAYEEAGGDGWEETFFEDSNLTVETEVTIKDGEPTDV